MRHAIVRNIFQIFHLTLFLFCCSLLALCKVLIGLLTPHAILLVLMEKLLFLLLDHQTLELHVSEEANQAIQSLRVPIHFNDPEFEIHSHIDALIVSGTSILLEHVDDDELVFVLTEPGLDEVWEPSVFLVPDIQRLQLHSQIHILGPLILFDTDLSELHLSSPHHLLPVELFKLSERARLLILIGSHVSLEDPDVDLVWVIVHPDLYTYQLHDEVKLHLGLLGVLKLRLCHLLNRGLSLHILCKDILMLALFLLIPTLYL